MNFSLRLGHSIRLTRNTIVRDRSGHFNWEPLAQSLFQEVVATAYVFNSSGLISLITAVALSEAQATNRRPGRT